MAHFTRTHGGVWEGLPPPTITFVSPGSGPFGITNVFVIHGTNLQYAQAVEQFFNSDGSPGNDFATWVVNSPTQITVTTSSLNPPQLMNIKVTTDTGSATAVGAWRYT